MKKPNTVESMTPCSGQYSFKQDMKLSAWLIVACGVYLVGLFVLKHYPDLGSGWKAAVTLAPLIPALLCLRTWVCFIRGLDELQRRMQLEVWLSAALTTVVVGATLSSLSSVGIRWSERLSGLGIGEALGLMFVFWIIGSIRTNRRFQ